MPRLTSCLSLVVLVPLHGLFAQGSPKGTPQGPPNAPAQRSPAPVTYVYVRGASDTVALETIDQSATRVEGVLTIRGQPRIEWAHARSGTTLGALTLRVFAPSAAPDAEPLQAGTAETRGDSVFVDFTGGGQRTNRAIASAAGAVPLVNASALHAALLGLMARAHQAKTLPVFLTSGAQTISATIAVAGDTTVFTLATSGMRVLTAPDGLPLSIELANGGGRITRAAGPVASWSGGAPAAATISYDAPAGAPYTAEAVSIPSGRGYTLAGTLTKPTGVAKMAVVVTISGSGPQERDSRIGAVPGYMPFRQIADTLGRRGVAVLRFDDRGVGKSGGVETLASATTADFADDVRAVVTYLRTRPDVDPSRIALVGHSEGGQIAPMVAATDPLLHGIVLLAGPAYTGRRIMLAQNRIGVENAPGLTRAQKDSIMARVPAQLDSAAASNRWIGHFAAYDPLPTARKVTQPVLLIQGETDQQVSPEQADTLAAVMRAAKNASVTLRKFPATNHLLLADPSGLPSGYAELPDMKVRPEILGALADWLVRVLK